MDLCLRDTEENMQISIYPNEVNDLGSVKSLPINKPGGEGKRNN